MSFFICFELLFVFFCSSYTIHHKYWSFPRECFPLVFMTNINAINIMILGIFCNRFRLGMENKGFLIINKLINSIPTKAITNIHCSETKSNLLLFFFLFTEKETGEYRDTLQYSAIGLEVAICYVTFRAG